MADGSQVSFKGVRVGVLQDSPELAGLLDQNLRSAGYAVEFILRGGDLASCLDERKPDLLIIDMELPGLDGVELLRRMRDVGATHELPIIVLTGQHEEADVIRALECGADDVVATPFSVAELLARVEAVLRRCTPDRASSVFVVGDIEFDRQAMRVRRRGKVVELGPTEMRLLDLFMTRPGTVLSRVDILKALWRPETMIDERTIDVHVGRLRKALLSARRSDPITTLRGAGYRFDPT